MADDLGSTRKELLGDLKVHQDSAQWEEVLAVCDRLWNLGERRLNIVFAAYKAAMSVGQSNKAEHWVDLGLQHCPPDWRLFRMKGNFFRGRDDLLQAQRMYERSVEIGGNDSPLPHAVIGKFFLDIGDFRCSAMHLSLALERSGDNANPVWFVQLGRAQSKLGLFMEARTSFARATGDARTKNVEWMIAELDRRLASGSSSMEATSRYYDDVFAERAEYQKSWHESIYNDCWIEIIYRLKAAGCSSILDLGCGPGQFADCVAELYPAASYHGLDFSEVAIEKARERQPSYRFTRVELPVDTYDNMGMYDGVVCTEVLEHIEQDVEVLQAIRSGVFVVFSVPSFDSFGHVRIFESRPAVIDRYGDVFDDLEIYPHKFAGGKILWIGCGIKA